MRFIDLHVHSTYSDGTDTPECLIKKAIECNLAAMALTDHDTVAGIPDALSAVKASNISGFQFIPGIEISAGYLNRDIHILGLFIDYESKALSEALTVIQENRKKRNLKMLELFSQRGFEFSYDELTGIETETTVTRAHFAKLLVNHGYVKNTAEAFKKYLDYNCPCYVPRTYISIEDSINIIHSAGGIASLAHPLLYGLDRPGVETLVQEVSHYGMDAIEAIYSSNIGHDEGYVRRLANHNGLKLTGGSDYHGLNKPQINLGIGRGNLKVPESILAPLLQNPSL